MFNFAAPKWLNFLKSLSEGLCVNVSLINCSGGTSYFCQCEHLIRLYGVSNKECFEIKDMINKGANYSQIKFTKCSLGCPVTITRINVIESSVILVICRSTHINSTETGSFDNSNIQEELSSKIKIIKQLIELYLYAVQDIDRLGLDTIQLTAVKEINNVISELIRIDQFEINSIFNLMVNFLLIVSGVEGSWIFSKLADGSVTFVQKGTLDFSEFIASTKFYDKFEEKILSKYEHGIYQKITYKNHTIGWIGVEKPAEVNSVLAFLNIFAHIIEIVLEIHHLYYYLSEKLGVILNTLPTGVLLLNQRQEIYYSNYLAEEILELNKQELFCKPLQNILGLSILPRNINRYTNANTLKIDFNSKKKILEFSHLMIRDSNDFFIGSVFSFVDRTEEVTLQEEIQKLARSSIASQLAAGVAHEIRNPLTSAKGFLQLIMQKSNENSIKQYAEIVINELDAVNNIITDFLTLARPAEPKKTIIKVEEILDSVKHIIQSDVFMYSGVDFNFNVEPNLPNIEVDANQIKQVILNLSKNAIEAMNGNGTLEIRTILELKYVTIKVINSGEAIPSTILKNIFNPFFTTKESGTGIGLAICKNIINSHGGKINVTSPMPEGGTMFEILLPIYR